MTATHLDGPFGASAPDNYQRFFVPAIGRPLAEDLLDEAKLVAGERVLDVGCGTGVVTRMAAERVRPGGRVAGVDINPGMLGVAKMSTPADLGIEWHEAGADSLPFEMGGFDAVLCQLSLQFMPDKAAAIREMHRVLTRGGRVVLNVPGPTDPLFETLANALDRHVAHGAGNFVRAVFSLHDEAELEDLLQDGGFSDVHTDAYVRDLPLPPAKDFLWQYVASTPLAGPVGNANPQTRAALEFEVLGDWVHYEDERGLSYHQRIVLASAHR